MKLSPVTSEPPRTLYVLFFFLDPCMGFVGFGKPGSLQHYLQTTEITARRKGGYFHCVWKGQRSEVVLWPGVWGPNTELEKPGRHLTETWTDRELRIIEGSVSDRHDGE